MAIATPEHKKEDRVELSVDQARRNLTELVNRAGYGDERIVLTRNGKPLAAIVGLADLGLLDRTVAA